MAKSVRLDGEIAAELAAAEEESKPHPLNEEIYCARGDPETASKALAKAGERQLNLFATAPLFKPGAGFRRP